MVAKSDVGVLTVYMDAVTDQFHAGLQGAEKAITSFRGQIKGLNRTFTEVKNKVAVVSAAFESAFKGIEVVAKVFKADLEGASDIIKQLPLGIGAAMTAYESMLLVVTGIGEEQRFIAERIAEIKRETEEATKAWREYRGAIDAASVATLSISEKTSVLREELDNGSNAAAALQRDLSRSDMTDKIEDQIRAQEELIQKIRDSLPHYLTISKEEEKSINRAYDRIDARFDEITAVHEYFDTLEEIAAAEAKRLDDAKALADALRRQNDLLKAQKDLESSKKTRERILGRGLQGASNTFTSPMGTISLPVLNTTAELARQQLTELRTIEQTISGLETTIKDLTKP